MDSGSPAASQRRLSSACRPAFAVLLRSPDRVEPSELIAVPAGRRDRRHRSSPPSVERSSYSGAQPRTSAPAITGTQGTHGMPGLNASAESPGGGLECVSGQGWPVSRPGWPSAAGRGADLVSLVGVRAGARQPVPAASSARRAHRAYRRISGIISLPPSYRLMTVTSLVPSKVASTVLEHTSNALHHLVAGSTRRRRRSRDTALSRAPQDVGRRPAPPGWLRSTPRAHRSATAGGHMDEQIARMRVKTHASHSFSALIPREAPLIRRKTTVPRDPEHLAQPSQVKVPRYLPSSI